MKKEQSVLEHVYEYQYRHAVTYEKTSGRIYCGLRIFYILSFVYAIIFGGLLIAGMALYRIPAEINILRYSYFAIVLFCAAFILMFFKLDSVAFLLNLTGAVFYTLSLWPSQVYDYETLVFNIQPSFWWRHFIPTVLILFISGWMALISTKEKYLINRDYKAVINGIYKHYNTDVSAVSSEEWALFIKNYEPPVKQKLKRSLKQKENKENSTPGV